MTTAFLSSQVAVSPRDVVQLDPDHCRWGAIFVVVDEVRPWGIQGHFLVPGQPGISYIRAKQGEYVRIGMAAWVIAEDDLGTDDDAEASRDA